MATTLQQLYSSREKSATAAVVLTGKQQVKRITEEVCGLQNMMGGLYSLNNRKTLSAAPF